MKAALPFCLKLVKYIKLKGFHMNTYDHCTDKNIVEIYQMDLVWYLYELNIYLMN